MSTLVFTPRPRVCPPSPFVANNGKPIALLTPLSDETLEETVSAVRRARAVNTVRKMRRIAEERGLSSMTEEEIQADIDAARRERSR